MNTKHFLAYHSVARMGYEYPLNGELRFFTTKRKAASAAKDQLVWVVEGMRERGQSQYALCGVYLVTDVEEGGQGDFSIHGVALWESEVPLELQALEWFPEFLRRNANFSLGFREINDRRAIDAFLNVAGADLKQALTHLESIKKIERLTAEDYAAALRASQLSDTEWDLLRVHSASPAATLTARQLAMALGWDNWRTTNLIYGKLASRLCKVLGVNPLTKLGVFVRFHHEAAEECQLVLRDSLALAIREVTGDNPLYSRLQEEIPVAELLYEGAVNIVQVNAFERNSRARTRCIAHYGTSCVVCGFDFGQVYGEIALQYIQVHHLTPLASIGESYRIDPVQDLRPVCANCHAVIHLRQPPYSVEEMRDLLIASNRPQKS